MRSESGAGRKNGKLSSRQARKQRRSAAASAPVLRTLSLGVRSNPHRRRSAQYTELDALVPAPRRRREDLDDQVRRSLNVLVGQDLPARVGDEQQVGLDDIEYRKDDIERREKGFAAAMRLEMRSDRKYRFPENALMRRGRARRHDMHPVNQLVPLPVVRELQEVAVRELPRWRSIRAIRCAWPASVPCRILPSSARPVPRPFSAARTEGGAGALCRVSNECAMSGLGK